jgi:hypothetical protein
MVGERLADDVSRYVGYTSDTTCYTDYKVVIIPSEFFDESVYGTKKSIPSLPFYTIEGVPFLFGTPSIERVGDTLIIHADLVASAYFLLSRYEELLHRDLRDEHGRFPGRQSILFRAGFIDCPIVDEYGKLLRRWLNQNGVQTALQVPYIKKINLTHDVDAPFSCRTWRNVARKVFAGQSLAGAIRTKYCPLEFDPYYTFPWIFQQNKLLQNRVGDNRCRTYLFLKIGGKTNQDKPHYRLNGKDMTALLALSREQGATVGLHGSYHSGMNPSLIINEKKKLEEALGAEVKHHRNHFLSSREPEDMEFLVKAGITDDYTMGYADVAGFRLGTSQPVKYINPMTKRLTTLTLHSLTIMDSTLNEPKYMNFSADHAKDYCLKLIQNIRNVNGELTLLWHNTSVVENNEGYLRELYAKLMNNPIFV